MIDPNEIDRTLRQIVTQRFAEIGEGSGEILHELAEFAQIYALDSQAAATLLRIVAGEATTPVTAYHTRYTTEPPTIDGRGGAG